MLKSVSNSLIFFFILLLKMFHSNAFENVRDSAPENNIDYNDFLDQFQETTDKNEYDMEEFNRTQLRDKTPDKPLFEYERPRTDNHSKFMLNLRHHGAKDPTEPYMNSDVDLQFHDKDPRGYLQEQDWRKFRELGLPRSKLTYWGKDGDYSVPGQGQRNEDIINKILLARKFLRGRLNWFSESLGNGTSGRGPITHNTNSEVGITDLEDIDPTVNDSETRQTINRIFSNEANLGGQFFKNKTTTDHVIPVSSYNHVFQTAYPMTPKSMTEMIQGDQKITTLNINEVPKTFVDFIQQREIYDGDSRFGKLWAQQNNRYTPGIREILTLMGITETDMKIMRERASDTKTVIDPAMKRIADFAQLIETMPENRRREIRNELLSQQITEFQGGVSGTVMNPEIKRIITDRNKSGPTGNKKSAPYEINIKNKPEINSGNKTVTNHKIRNDLVNQEIKINNLIREGKVFIRGGSTGQVKQGISEVKIHNYNFSNISNKSNVVNYKRGKPGKVDILNDPEKHNHLKSVIQNYVKLESEHDTNFGTEHAFDYNLIPYAESKQYLTR